MAKYCIVILQDKIHTMLQPLFLIERFLYSLNQTTRCQTFMDILKKRKEKKNKQKNDTKWNYMV